MKFTNEEKKFWKRNFDISSINDIPESIDHLDFRLEDFTDTELFWICSRIHHIDMLDLDETLITDAGIQHLTLLENIKELRLKGNNQLTNACIPYLKELTTLELLHIGGTSLTIDSIIQLKTLINLKKLLFSLEDEKEKEMIDELVIELPDCEIIINNQIYYL